jgi:hypothetical protein
MITADSSMPWAGFWRVKKKALPKNQKGLHLSFQLPFMIT